MKPIFPLALVPLAALATPAKQAPPTVYFFVGTHCPIVAKYAGRIEALGKQFSARGVRCVLVDSNVDESDAEFSRWATSRGLTLPRLSDRRGELARKLGASVTPEAALVDGAGVVRYLGRIDDSVEPKSVAQRDLLLAVDSMLAGKPVARPRLLATGCGISFSALPLAPKKTVTYYKDVKPILEKSCVSCHRPGEVAPFSLATYAEASAWATPIRRFTQSRQMPPWKAAPGHGEFFDSRWLSGADLKTLAAWDASGAPEGRPTGTRPVKFPPPGSWPLGAPDVTASPSDSYKLAAGGEDVYRHFLLPVDTSRERHVAAFDFQPGNRRIVHHVILYCVTDPSFVGKDGADGQPGWPATGSPLSEDGIRMVAGWAPGSTARRLSPEVGFTLPQGSKLVAEVHYHPSGRAESDRTKVGIYWTKAKPKRGLNTYAVGEDGFVLKPDVANQKVEAELEVPEDITLWSVFPHMHQLGKTMRVWATLPSGAEMRLIKIENWEFKWQGFYQYREPVFLPRGTKLVLEATYDNTRNNPDQPSLPPKEVRYGEQTTDEMCFAFFNFSMGKPPK